MNATDERGYVGCKSAQTMQKIGEVKAGAKKLEAKIKLPCFDCVCEGKTKFDRTCGHP